MNTEWRVPGPASPAIRSPIPTVLRSQVWQLNRAYLELLGSCPIAEDAPAAGGLPTAVLAGLLASPPSARDRIAECSVTLFNLRFTDTAFWAAGAVALVAEATARDYARPGHRQFLEMALFFAWHVAQHSELAARLLLAMPASTHRAFCALPLAQLSRYAATCEGLLQPRWSDHPCFWPDLLLFAAQGEPQSFEAARLLGFQLIMMDVDPGGLPCGGPRAGATARRRPAR